MLTICWPRFGGLDLWTSGFVYLSMLFLRGGNPICFCHQDVIVESWPKCLGIYCLIKNECLCVLLVGSCGYLLDMCLFAFLWFHVGNAIIHCMHDLCIYIYTYVCMLDTTFNPLALSLSLYIYIYIYLYACMYTHIISMYVQTRVCIGLHKMYVCFDVSCLGFCRFVKILQVYTVHGLSSVANRLSAKCIRLCGTQFVRSHWAPKGLANVLDWLRRVPWEWSKWRSHSTRIHAIKIFRNTLFKEMISKNDKQGLHKLLREACISAAKVMSAPHDDDTRLRARSRQQRAPPSTTTRTTFPSPMAIAQNAD